MAPSNYPRLVSFNLIALDLMDAFADILNDRLFSSENRTVVDSIMILSFVFEMADFIVS